MDRKLRVFLCHSSQDKPIVRELYQRLNAEGWIDPWLDEEKLLPGQDWNMEIEKAVEAADIVIVWLSNNSISKEGYIQRELKFVLDIALDKPEGAIFIIPLRLDNVEPPRRLRAWQYVDYFPIERQEQSYQRLIQSLCARFSQFSHKVGDGQKNSPEFFDHSASGSEWELSEKDEHRSKTKNYYFGCQLTEESNNDLRKFIERIFLPKGWVPCYAEREFNSQFMLLDICKKLYFADFGIFDVSIPNANVYIELGIALAFNKKILVIARDGSSMPLLLSGPSVIFYKDYMDLTQKLEASFEALFREKMKFIDFCNYCERICEGLTVYPDRNTYLFMEKRGLLSGDTWDDIKSVFEPHLQKWNLQSVSLSKNDSRSLLCNIRKKVRATQFSILHLGNLAQSDAYIALGMSIGYCRPWILISKTNDDDRENTIPSNLLDLDLLRYSSLEDLNTKLENGLPGFANLLYLSPRDTNEGTAIIEREKTPFWFLLSEWLEKKQVPRTTGIGKGMLRLVQVGNYGFHDKFLITRKGIEIGRDPVCDVVVAHGHVSNKHARIYEQDGAYYLQDLNSRNGTYYNGRRLLPKAIERIIQGDRIRLAHAERYLVWDENPLPRDSYFMQPDRVGTAELEPVEIILSTEGASGPDDGLDYTYLLDVQGVTNGIFQVQSYYRLGRVLEVIAKIRKFLEEDHCFVYRAKLVNEAETILDLNMQTEDPLYIVAYKDLVRNIFMRKVKLIDNDELHQYVDFIVEETKHGEKRIVMVYATKSDIGLNQVKDLIYAPILYKEKVIFQTRERLLSELADSEKSFREIQEAKRQSEQLGRSIVALVGKVIDNPEGRLYDLNRVTTNKREALDKLRKLESTLMGNIKNPGPMQRELEIRNYAKDLQKHGVVLSPLAVDKLIVVSSESAKKKGQSMLNGFAEEYIMDKVSRSRTIEVWQNGNSN